MTQDNLGIVGNYELIELIGSGAQGHVYRARRTSADGSATGPDSDTGRIVALKMVTCTGLDQSGATRIERSAEILRTLSHANIVRYLDSFPWQREWDETRCLVTELLDGETLDKKMLNHPDGLPWKLVARIFEQCIEGLIHAREKGVVHRDLKPSNIFLLKDDTVKLIDFDIARLDDATTTGSKCWLGSFDYMAPDFARMKGFRGDEQSDIFSLGVCIYQALTGQLPYKKLGTAADAEYLHRWRTGREPGLSFQPPVFRVLERQAPDFFRMAIEPDRARRYQSFTAMLEGLRKISNRTVESGGSKYELEEMLGHGGFGEVFRARRLGDDKAVAIKRLFADLQSRRFIKEAQLLKRLHHERLVEYVDFADTPDVGGSHHYFLIMELLPGMPGWTLRNRLKTSGSGIDVMECLELFSHYLECVQYLHEHKIIHRDIKPANLYAPTGNPAGAKVFDLGIARDVSGTATSGYVPGTLEYMPPELAREGGDRGSPQSDIYSTGLSLYEAVTGKPAYKRLPPDEREAFQQFLNRSIFPGETVNYDLPVFANYPRLVPIIRKAIDIDPKARYAGAAEMKHDIDAMRTEIRLASERTTASRAARASTTGTALPDDSGTMDSAGSTTGDNSHAAGLSHMKLKTAAIFASAMLVAILTGVWLTSRILAPGRNPAPARQITVSKAPSTPVTAPATPAPVQAPAVAPAVITNTPQLVAVPSAEELAMLIIEIDGETTALMEFFSLSMAEDISKGLNRAEAMKARLSAAGPVLSPQESQHLRTAMDRLVIAATNQVFRLRADEDLAGLRTWSNAAPVLVAIPPIRRALDRALAEGEAAKSAQDWLERHVAIETAIASLSPTNVEVALPLLQRQVADLEKETGNSVERTNQVAYVVLRVATRIETIAGELSAAAAKAYAADNLKDGDAARRKAENLRNLLKDRVGRNDIDKLLAKSSAERDKAQLRLAANEPARLAAAARAEQARARGARLELRVPQIDPPVTTTYRRSGTVAREELRATNQVTLPPATYTFRFTRPDYIAVETEASVAPGAETLVVTMPLKWGEGEPLVRLRNAEKAMSSEPRDMPALDAAFNATMPVFEWPEHATRFLELHSQWSRLRESQFDSAMKSAEEAVSAYILWLYQVYDPASGTYRRYKAPMPPIAFHLPDPVGTNRQESAGEISARLARLRAWEAAGPGLQTSEGQSALAQKLAQYAAEMETNSASESAKCRFESTLLLSRPGIIPTDIERLGGSAEAARWVAHAKYAPRISTLDSLKSLAGYTGKGGKADACDVRMALYSAYYTWRNAVAGEYEYALEVNTALGTILNSLDQKSSEAVISFLGTAILQDNPASQEGEPCLYMMNALSFMPGLAHGSDLKRAATAWLDAHGNNPSTTGKAAGIRESLNLLKTLLKVGE